jgi:hypothetical protein
MFLNDSDLGLKELTAYLATAQPVPPTGEFQSRD